MEMAGKEETEGRCPACRTPYNKAKVVGMAANCERLTSELNMLPVVSFVEYPTHSWSHYCTYICDYHLCHHEPLAGWLLKWIWREKWSRRRQKVKDLNQESILVVCEWFNGILSTLWACLLIWLMKMCVSSLSLLPPSRSTPPSQPVVRHVY